MSADAAPVAGSDLRERFQRAVVGMLLALGAQFVFGMVTNLFVTVPDRHPGAGDPNFFGGIGHVLVWAVTAGGVALAVHAALGLALLLNAIVLVVIAARTGARGLTVLAVLGLLFVLGAGFNGASFLEHDTNGNSLAMALLFALAVAVYVVTLLTGAPRTGRSVTTPPDE